MKMSVSVVAEKIIVNVVMIAIVVKSPKYVKMFFCNLRYMHCLAGLQHLDLHHSIYGGRLF